MSDVIHLLPESIANQIAALEVVQSPAAAVKELLENAIDAGASAITLEVVQGGKTSIHVLDNGCGMSPVDARMAFEKHATSKIKTAEDLYNLSTMGFRGEALAAIAAVSDIELRSRRADHELGTELTLSASKVQTIEPCVAPIGTSIKVRNLLFNIPARRRFLKSDRDENVAVRREFVAVALANPSVAMKLIADGSLVLDLPESSLKGRILDVAGRVFDKKLLSLSYTSNIVSITGYVTKPQAATKSGVQRFTFVNGRYMKPMGFQKAIELAYEGLIPDGTHPSFFIYFTVPPENIDINRSPDKKEIRFADEQLIFTLLRQLIRESLSANVSVPVIDFSNERILDIPAYKGREELPVSSSEDSEATPAVARRVFMAGNQMSRPSSDGEGRWGGSLHTSSMNINWDALGEGFSTPAREEELFAPDAIAQMETLPSDMRTPNDHPTVGHLIYKGRYIVTSLRRNLVLIDLKRASERILYDRYLMDIEEGRVGVQQTLLPDHLELTTEEADTLRLLDEDLAQLGFVIEPAKVEGSFVVTQAPISIQSNVHTLLRQLIHYCIDTGEHSHSYLAKAMARSMAEMNAYPYGSSLEKKDVDGLLSQLFASSDPNLSPRGETIMTTLLETEIDRRFV